MSTDNAIEVFNCSLCNFCETSLDGLVKHIRSHIKPEPECHEKTREKKSASDVCDSQPTKSMSENESKQSSGFYEKHMRYMSEERNNIMTSAENNTLQPHSSISQHPDVSRDFPAKNNADYLGKSSKDYSIKSNTHIQSKPINGNGVQSNSYLLINNANRREHHFHNVYRPSLYGENSQVVSLQNAYHQGGQPQFPMKPPPRYNTALKHSPHPYKRQTDQTLYHEHQRPPPYEREYAGSHYGNEVMKQPRQNNSLDGFRRNLTERNNENSRHLTNLRNNIDLRKEHHPIPPKESMIGLNSMPVKRPVSHMNDHHHSNHHMRSQISPNNRQTFNNQITNIQPDMRSIDKNIGIPNHGNVFFNQNQLLHAAGQLPLDKLSGVLLVPLKKTTEIGVQTEHHEHDGVEKVSCQVQTDLKMGNLLESHLSHNNIPTGHIRSLEDVIECPVCANEFQHEDRLKEHMSTFHTIICQKCSFSSTNINEYNVHREECESKDEFLCLDCNKVFNSVRMLNIHREVKHNVTMGYRCGICNAPFEAHELVMKHIVTHDYSILHFKCNYAPCTKVFETMDALNIHTGKHRTMTVMHECRFCNLTFSSTNLLHNHIGDVHVLANTDVKKIQPQRKSDHLPVVKPPPLPETDRKIFLCDHCNLAFRNRFFLKKHIDMCSKNANIRPTQFICDVCNEFFQNEQLKIDHMKIDHRRENGNRCPKCSKSYRTWFKLKSHTIQQHSKKTCRECSLVFTKDPDLRKHEEEIHGKALTQPGERVYKCSICDATLFTLTDLMNHRKELHSSVLQSKTAAQKTTPEKCNQGFPTTKDLENVIDDPSNEGEFEDPSFLESDDQAEEEESELSVETCPKCNNIFTSKQDLQGHMSEVHNETMSETVSNNPFSVQSDSLKCGRCDKYFDDKRRLKNHLGLIHGQRPFECKICRKKFQYSSQVFWHMKKQHRNTLKGTIKPSVKGKLPSYSGSSSTSALSKPPEFDCERCGKTFRTKMQLQVHMKNFHSNNDVSSVNNINDDLNNKPDSYEKFPNDYKCHICNAAFQQLERYQDHMSTHVGKEINGPSYLNENLPSMVMLNGGEAFDRHKEGETYVNRNDREIFDDHIGDNLSEHKSDSDFDDLELSGGDKNEMDSQRNIEHELLKGEPVFDVSLGEYICPICQKTTKSITGMKTHYGRVHYFWSKETTHKDDVVQLKVWQCNSCDREFGQFQNLLDHTQSIHGYLISQSEAEMSVRYETKTRNSSTKYNYACPHCDVSFDNSKAIRVHTFKKHGVLLNESDLLLWRSDRNDPNLSTVHLKPKIELPDIRYKCQLCMSKFVSTKAIRIHSFKRHGIVLTKKEVLKCKVNIRKPQVTDPFLSRHRGKDLIEEPHPCEECGRVFGNYRALFTHYRQAHRAINATKVPKKPSRTEISANFPSNIANPVSIKPTEPNPVVTQTSSENLTESPSMVKSSSLETDNKVQETVPTIQCPKCDRIFTQRKSLMTHMYSAHHITKDNYHLYWPDGMPELPRKSSQCPTCGKVCIDERAVRIHIFKAHGVRYQDLVNQNERRVEKEPVPQQMDSQGAPLECIICSKQFRRRQALILHELKAHRIKWSGSKRVLTTKNFPKINPSTSSPHDNTYSQHEDKLLNNNQKPIPQVDETNGFVCPICSAFYANRRAITTHLCRIHRYNKDALHSYFEKMGATIQQSDTSIEQTQNESERHGDGAKNGESTGVKYEEVYTPEKDKAEHISHVDNNRNPVVSESGNSDHTRDEQIFNTTETINPDEKNENSLENISKNETYYKTEKLSDNYFQTSREKDDMNINENELEEKTRTGMSYYNEKTACESYAFSPHENNESPVNNLYIETNTEPVTPVNTSEGHFDDLPRDTLEGNGPEFHLPIRFNDVTSMQKPVQPYAAQI